MEPTIASETNKDRLEQISPDRSTETVETEKLATPEEILSGPQTIAHDVPNQAVEASGGLPSQETAQSVGDILKQGDNAIVETLPTEEEKRAAINAAIFSDIGPWRANNIATGSVDSETE